jgi:hypothetical protein
MAAPTEADLAAKTSGPKILPTMPAIVSPQLVTPIILSSRYRVDANNQDLQTTFGVYTT